MSLRLWTCLFLTTSAAWHGVRAHETQNATADIHLVRVIASASSNRLLVTADGFQKNLALIEDKGDHGEVVRAERVGQSFDYSSPFISADGTRLGLAARDTSAFGQAFFLFHESEKAPTIFPAFGDAPQAQFDFAATDDGKTVVVPGTYGCVCWVQKEDGWKEAWAIDDWKKTRLFDAPLEGHSEMLPSFNATIPPGADYALITFNAYARNPSGTISANAPPSNLAAIALNDGKERWRYVIPASTTRSFASVLTGKKRQQCLLKIQSRDACRFVQIDGGKALGEWDEKSLPHELVNAFQLSRQGMRAAFDKDSQSLVFEDPKDVTEFDLTGKIFWPTDAFSLPRIAIKGERIYAAGSDGRLRCIDGNLKILWELDCIPALQGPHAKNEATAVFDYNGALIVQPTRAPTTSPKVPKGENLLRLGKATLTLGGTKNKIGIAAETLTNGKLDDVETPWMNPQDVTQCTETGRKVFAEIEFKKPTDVKSLTVYESNLHPEAWPREAVVQVWNADSKAWTNATCGLFLIGPINTYTLDLKGATKIRYVPWSGYQRNFYTCEIEVR